MSTVQWPPSGDGGWGDVECKKKYFLDYSVLSAVNVKHIMSLLDQQSKKDSSFNQTSNGPIAW